MKKKLLNFVIAICLIIPCCFSLVACNKGKDPENQPKDYTQHETFTQMIEDIITSFQMKDTEEAAPQTFGFVNSASPVSASNGSLLDSLLGELDDLDSHEYKQAKTWFEGMCTSIFTYPLGTSDALKNTFKEENLYDVVMEVYSFIDGEPGQQPQRESRKMVIQSKSDTHKVILVAGENGLVRCDFNYFGQGNFNFEYIDIEYNNQGGFNYIDYCYGDSLKNVVEVYASNTSDLAFATWYDGLTCLEYNGTKNQIISDCIDKIIEVKNPLQYKQEMETLYNSAYNYSMLSDDLYAFMDVYLADIWAAQEEELGPFYQTIADNCLFGIPKGFVDQTIVMPDNIDSFIFGLPVPSTVTKIIIPDNVKYIKEPVANYNHFAEFYGWPKSTEPEQIDNGDGLLAMNYIEIPIEYANCLKTPLIVTEYGEQNVSSVPFAGEIQFSGNSELLSKSEWGLQVKLVNLDGVKEDYLFRLNNVDEFLEELIPSDIFINTEDYDFTNKQDDRFNLKIQLYDSNGAFIVEMVDGNMLNNIQENKDLYDAFGNKIMRFDNDEKKMYVVEGSSETWIYDYSDESYNYPKANVSKIKALYPNISPVANANIFVQFTEYCDGSYYYNYLEDGLGVFRLSAGLDSDEFFDAPQTLIYDFYAGTFKDEQGNDYASKIENGSVNLINNKFYEYKGSSLVRRITEFETFYFNYTNEMFIKEILSKIEFKVLDNILDNLVNTVDVLDYVNNITINSNEEYVDFNFLLKNADNSRSAEINNVTINFINNNLKENKVMLPYVKSIEKLTVSSDKELTIYSGRSNFESLEWVKVGDLELNGNFTTLTVVEIEIDGDYTLNLPESCLVLDNSGNGFGAASPTLKVNGNLTLNLPEGARFSIKMIEEYDPTAGCYNYYDFYTNFTVSGKVIINTSITYQEMVSAYQKVLDLGSRFQLSEKESFAFNLYGLIYKRKTGTAQVELDAGIGGSILGSTAVGGNENQREMKVSSSIESISLTDKIIYSNGATVKVYSDQAKTQEVTDLENISLNYGDNVLYISFIDVNDATNSYDISLNIYRYKMFTITIELYDGEKVIETSNISKTEEFAVGNIDVFVKKGITSHSAKLMKSENDYKWLYSSQKQQENGVKHTYIVDYITSNVTLRLECVYDMYALNYYVQDQETGETIRSYVEWFTINSEDKETIENPFDYCTVRGWYLDSELTEPVTSLKLNGRTEELHIYADATNLVYTIVYNMEDGFIENSSDVYTEKIQVTDSKPAYDYWEINNKFAENHLNDKAGYTFNLYWDEDGTQVVDQSISFETLYEKYGTETTINVYGKFKVTTYRVYLLNSDRIESIKDYFQSEIMIDTNTRMQYFNYTIEDEISLDFVNLYSGYTYYGWLVIKCSQDSGLTEGSAITSIPKGTTGEIRLALLTKHSSDLRIIYYLQGDGAQADYDSYIFEESSTVQKTCFVDEINATEFYKTFTGYSEEPSQIRFYNGEKNETITDEFDIQYALSRNTLTIYLYYDKV